MDKKQVFAGWIFVFVFVVVLVGCTKNDEVAVKEATIQALTALQFGDIVGRNDIFTLDAMLAMQKGYRSFIGFSIVSLGHSFTDDELSLLKSQGTQINPQYIVYVTIKHDQFRSEQYVVLMEEIDNNWKLASMTTVEHYKKMQ